MNAQELLNADMATIGRAVRAGWTWWLDELKALAPARLSGFGKSAGARLFFVGGEIRSPAGETPRLTGGWTLVLPSSAALVRRVEVPAMRASEVTQLLRLESDRYFPLPPGAALVAHGPLERVQAGRVAVDAAALPLDSGRKVAAVLAAQDLQPSAIRLAGEGPAPDPRFDFAPAFKAAGLGGARDGSAHRWWMAVGVLFLANVAMLAWRDIADVQRLETLVEEQRPAVAIAQRLTHRMRQNARLVERAAQRRAGAGALGLLTQVTVAVPNEAWVQRYDWDERTLRLAGYHRPELNLPAALRSAPFAASIRNAQTDTLAEVAAGQPFDVNIRLRER